MLILSLKILNANKKNEHKTPNLPAVTWGVDGQHRNFLQCRCHLTSYSLKANWVYIHERQNIQDHQKEKKKSTTYPDLSGDSLCLTGDCELKIKAKDFNTGRLQISKETFLGGTLLSRIRFPSVLNTMIYLRSTFPNIFKAPMLSNNAWKFKTTRSEYFFLITANKVKLQLKSPWHGDAPTS